MKAMQEKLFSELRQTKAEIENSLTKRVKEDWLTEILREELADVDSALDKLESGKFGQCEISGELLPWDLLNSIPTIKSINDSKMLGFFCKKSIDSHE